MSIGLILALGVSQVASAQDQVCVFQESVPGHGDFAFLGTIEVYDRSTDSAATVYRYGNPWGASYNGNLWPGVAPVPIEETSQLFVVNTNDGPGVSLFFVHDIYNDEEGGTADMQFNLIDDTAGVLVEDDPGETIIVTGGGTQFNSDHEWWPCCTDGGVIGTLEGVWTMDVQFLGVDMTRITDWQATSADGSMMPLALELERRVRLQPCHVVSIDIKPTSCPNPLNTKSEGVLPVAILGTEDFDVTTIDPASVKLEGVSPLRWSIEDVATPFNGVSNDDCLDCTIEGPDGYDDLTLKFAAQEIVEALGDVEDGECIVLRLTGNLVDGILLTGIDVVSIINKTMEE